MVRTSWWPYPVNTVRRLYRQYFKNIVHDYRSILFLGLWAAAGIFGYTGYSLAFMTLGETKTPLDIVYMTMQLFAINYKLTVPPPNFLLQAARFLAPAMMFSTIILLIIKGFFESFSNFLLRVTGHHVIICGLGLLGPVLVERFSERGYPVVVIERNPNPGDIELCKAAGAIILTGDVRHLPILKKAGVTRAQYLVSVTGDDELNAEIAGLAAGIPRKLKNIPLTCYLHIVDLNLYTLLKATGLQKTHAPVFRLDLFNIYETAGTAILDHPKPFLNQNTDPSSVRFLIIGLGRMGESLIFQAVKQWRLHYGTTGKKIPITIIDKHALQKMKSFLLRYPSLSTYCDLQPVVMDITSPEFLKADFLATAQDQIAFSRIFIVVGNPSVGLAAALTLHKKLQDREDKNHPVNIPLVIRTNHETGLSRYLETLKTGDEVFSNLHVFPIIDENCNLDVILNTTHETIARAIHRDYLKNERESGHTPESNPRMVPWEKLPEEYKDSNRYQADHSIEKLRAIRCGVTPDIHWDDPLFDISPYSEKLAEIEHERWMKEKISAGWKWGPARDERWWHRRHPSIIPWKDLAESEKDKDRNSVKILPALLKSVDLKIKRL
jgi:hypothetical protein